jgi:hypothetical protein
MTGPPSQRPEVLIIEGYNPCNRRICQQNVLLQPGALSEMTRDIKPNANHRMLAETSVNHEGLTEWQSA